MDPSTSEAVERVDRDDGDENRRIVPFYRRPRQTVFDPMTTDGFRIDRASNPP